MRTRTSVEAREVLRAQDACVGKLVLKHYGPREKWPAYLAYRPDERLFFNAYTREQVEAYVKANPTRWMVNPYAGDGVDVALLRDLQRLYAGGLPRIDGTRHFHRDAAELEAERDLFKGLERTAR